MSDTCFLPDALGVNRTGRLTDRQLDHLKGIISRTHDGLAGLIGRGTDPLFWDTKAGRVESADGAILKRITPYGPGQATPGSKFEIRLTPREGRTRIFWTFGSLYEYATEASMARLFYLPRSRWVVNIERLPDPPPAGDVGEQTKADTIARQGAFARDVESYLPDPDVAAAQPPAPAEAMVGTWTSPFGTITFGADGTVSAHLGDGSDYRGRWSVDADGSLHADIMGTPIVGKASVSRDRLTLVMDGQALELRRAPGSE